MGRLTFKNGKYIDVPADATPESVAQFIASKGANPADYKDEIGGYFAVPSQGAAKTEVKTNMPQAIIDIMNQALVSNDKKAMDRANAAVTLYKNSQSDLKIGEAAKKTASDDKLKNLLAAVDSMQEDLNKVPDGPISGWLADHLSGAPALGGLNPESKYRVPVGNYETNAGVVAGELAKDTLGRVNQTELDMYLNKIFPKANMYRDVQSGKFGVIRNLLQRKLGTPQPQDQSAPNGGDVIDLSKYINQ